MSRKPQKKPPTRAPSSSSSTKRCSRCSKTKPKSDFARNKALADGLSAYCRACKRDDDRARRRGGAQAEPTEKPQAPSAEVLAVPPPAKRRARGARGPEARITPDIIDAVCEPLRKGHSRRVAARCAGINEDTLASWMLRGREAKDPAAPTRELYDAVLEAEGEGLRSLEEKAIGGAEIDHVQALRLLERRDPETWARREPKAAEGESNQMEIADVRKLLTERLNRFIELPPEPPPAPPGAPDA